MLEHGGRLRRAARRFGLAPQEWLDLSTGVSPYSWLDDRPMDVPRDAWLRLPEDEDELAQAAREYYGTEALPVAGSQAAIQSLPRLRATCRVGVIAPGYGEHAHGWRRAGHEVVAVPPERCAAAARELDVLVLSHPNNPTGTVFEPQALVSWHRALARRGGWLLVDEAFMDATPERSLVPEAGCEGLIILRSLGKFFGLAGARVGFVLAGAELRTRLAEILGPWTIAGASRYLAAQALQDGQWQRAQRVRLQAAGQRLSTTLRDAGLPPDGGCALFQWVCTPSATRLHECLAGEGILTRLFDEPSSLRFGLPHEEADWQRLHACLRKCRA